MLERSPEHRAWPGRWLLIGFKEKPRTGRGFGECRAHARINRGGSNSAGSAGLPFDVLKPLIAQTAAKALDATSPADVQTGPAVRNDTGTRARHCALLDDDLQLKNIYSIISNSIWETSKKI